MWFMLLNAYCYFFSAVLGATVLLILCQRSWGRVPWLLTELLLFLQDRFAVKVSETPAVARRLEIIQRRHHGQFFRDIGANYLPSEARPHDIDNFNSPAAEETDYLQLLEVEAELVQAGMEAVIQDDLLFTCEFSPVTRWNALSVPRQCLRRLTADSLLPWLVFAAGCVVRYLFLLPLRCCLMIASLIFLTGGAVFSLVHKYSHSEILYIGGVFSRLFCAAIGVVAEYDDDEGKNRPRGPGIAIANHLSANDIQMLYCDTKEWGYTITGQKHNGIIGWVEKTAGRVGSTLWLERSNAIERRDFQKDIVECATNPTKDPILLFPEGYCSNGVAVSQFRKSCFVENVDFYPIAVTQDPRLGDAFWKEDTFLPYLFRLMTSFAIMYKVRYLPVTRKKQSETTEEFARRLQQSIADANDGDAIPFDIGVLKKKSEQNRLRDRARNMCAQIVNTIEKSDLCSEVLPRG